MKELKHLELFAGIGGFRRAIDLFCNDNKITSTCVGFSEIDKYAVQSYKSIHSAHSELALGDIKQFTSDKKNIKKLPDFDLISGGFPCQAFSMMGKQKGFEDDRGNIFYSIIEILKIKKPNFLLLENVRNLKNHDDGKTYKEIKRSLTEDAGYDVKSIILDTKNYGLPQTRRRIFLFGVKKEHVSKKTSNIENELITTFKFLGLTSQDFVLFFENKKKGYRYSNTNTKKFFDRLYLANKLKTYNDIGNYNLNHRSFIENSSPLYSHQSIIPNNEFQRLKTKFDITKDFVDPDIIILDNKDMIINEHVLDKEDYCLMYKNNVYLLYIAKETIEECKLIKN